MLKGKSNSSDEPKISPLFSQNLKKMTLKNKEIKKIKN